MDIREQRGLLIAALCKLKRRGKTTWLVPSQSGRKKSYIVDLAKQTCTCPDWEEAVPAGKCKHIHAVEIMLKRERGKAKAREISQMEIKDKETSTKYKQDWAKYNEAQAEEKKEFQVLLRDLCKGIPEPPRKSTGRPRKAASEAIFVMAYKVYTTFSTRRFQIDLRQAHKEGYIPGELHYNCVSNYFEDERFTPILNDLIVESSLPLTAVETRFAIDATGFSASRFERWVDKKHDVKRKRRDWLKVQVICGVTTGIVTNVNLTKRDAENPYFGPLVRSTARNFDVQEIYADKAYSAHLTLDAAANVGAMPFIPFKKGASPRAGGLWEKFYHYYHLHPDEFAKHYHQRSNVESAFSAIKRKFGNYLRSRSLKAMRNEALCRILCHNIACLIRSTRLYPITASFWKTKNTGDFDTAA